MLDDELLNPEDDVLGDIVAIIRSMPQENLRKILGEFTTEEEEQILHRILVELGQIAFVFLVLGLARSFRALEIRWPRWAEVVPAYAVGTLGAFWFIERTALLMGWM